MSKVTSSYAGTCSNIVLAVVADDDSAIDATVFTVDGSSAPASYSLTTESSNIAKISTYSYKVVAKYTGDNYTYAGEGRAFQIVIDDPCSAVTLTVDSTIFSSSSISYNIFYSPHIETLDVN